MPKMRLDKLLSHLNCGSRKEVQSFIRAGRVGHTLTCNDKGEAVFSMGGDGIRMLRAYRERDKAAPMLGTWSSFSYYAQKGDRDVLNIFTDRKIYRPGTDCSCGSRGI